MNPQPTPPLTISEEAKAITKWARDNRLGYIAGSILEEFAQRAINQATAKLEERVRELEEEVAWFKLGKIPAKYKQQP